MSRSHASAASVAVIAAALAAVAFGAGGGTVLGRTTVVEVLLVLVGGPLAAAAVAFARPGLLYGGVPLLALGALTALSAISITWSIAPELSFVDTGRMLAYLAVFAAAIGAGRLFPLGAPVLLKAIVLAGTAVVAYGLASRVWPGSLAANELSNRLGEPYGYWNALGTTAALMVPPALWLGARRTGTVLGRALAYPALGLAILTIALTQSRGAVASAAIAAALWFALVPLRLRSIPVLVVPAAGAAPVAAWALSKTAFSKALQPLAVREAVAGEFGLLVLLMAVGLLLAGFAIGLGLARGAPPVHVRRRLGIAAVAVVVLVPLIGLTRVAFSSRGLGGTISDRVHDLTNENATQPSQGAGRFTSASNSRARYWREAGKVFSHHELKGTGDNTFSIARLRYRTTELFAGHAHGFVPQTLADLGLLGLGLSVALLLAWLVSAARATALYPRRLLRGRPERRDWDGQRIALVGTTLSAVAFGLQSAIDWTWFVPGPAVMALVAAGFVAGHGPLAAVAPTSATAELPALGHRRLFGRLPLPASSPARVAAAAAIVVCALLCAWAVWQPERSDRLSTRSLELIDAGRYQQAEAKARDAHNADPLSPKPLLVEASAQSAAGDKLGALATLERAVLRYPGDPQTWLRLGSFQLQQLRRPGPALQTAAAALYLDPKSKAGRSLYARAQARLRTQPAGR